MQAKTVKAVSVMKGTIWALSIYAFLALWLYGRTQNPVLSLLAGAMLLAMVGLVFYEYSRRYGKSSPEKKVMQQNADLGTLRLLSLSRQQATEQLVETMSKKENLAVLTWHDDICIAQRGGKKLGFLCDASEGAQQVRVLFSFHKACRCANADKGVLILLGRIDGKTLKAAHLLSQPFLTLLTPAQLAPYFAEIGRDAGFTPPILPKATKPISLLFTTQTARRAMITSFFMMLVYLVLGGTWFLPPALALACFASICRYRSGKPKKLF